MGKNDMKLRFFLIGTMVLEISTVMEPRMLNVLMPFGLETLFLRIYPKKKWNLFNICRNWGDSSADKLHKHKT